jgi:hypothetical protein
METKLRQKSMQIVRNKLGFEGMLVVNPLGQSGGLALLWQEANEVNIQNYSLRHIFTIITTAKSDSSWRLTGFYGHPNRAHREESWKLLTFLQHLSPLPWLCVGDFNEIIDPLEKVGGALRSVRQMEQFRLALDACQLCNLGF